MSRDLIDSIWEARAEITPESKWDTFKSGKWFETLRYGEEYFETVKHHPDFYPVKPLWFPQVHKIEDIVDDYYINNVYRDNKPGFRTVYRDIYTKGVPYLHVKAKPELKQMLADRLADSQRDSMTLRFTYRSTYDKETKEARYSGQVLFHAQNNLIIGGFWITVFNNDDLPEDLRLPVGTVLNK